ncbi:MAG: sporulation protein YqfD [Oscillospiraceae bacterium]|nr:sporulation protein YqfD [Oscillospiraceae bacterium]
MYIFFDRTVSFFKGTVTFSVSNGFYGVFISDCRRKNIPLRNVKTENGMLTGETDMRFLQKLNAAAEEAGVDIEVTKSSGLPLIFMRCRRRYGVAAGLLAALIMMLYFSSVLWSVDINGTDKSEIYLVRETLAECGVCRGTPLRKINKDEAEDRLNTLSPDIQRSSVNIIGNRAYVEIFEREVLSETDGDFLYSDIVASKDGEVLKADVFQGQSAVKDGQTVKKGDVLVKGEVAMKEEKVRYTESKARIIARTQNSVSISSAKTLYADAVNERKNYYSICFFGFTVPVTQGAKAELTDSNEYLLNTADTVFPIGIARRTVLYTEKRDIILSDGAAFLMCAADFATDVHDRLRDRNIVSIEASVKNGTSVVIEANVVCEEDICETVTHGGEAQQNLR